jgi:hypothetical protein
MKDLINLFAGLARILAPTKKDRKRDAVETYRKNIKKMKPPEEK